MTRTLEEIIADLAAKRDEWAQDKKVKDVNNERRIARQDGMVRENA